MSKDAKRRRDAPKINSQRKGKRVENEACKLWHRWEKFKDCRRLYDQAHEGSYSPDIGCPEMVELFWIEVKGRKHEPTTTSLLDWMFGSTLGACDMALRLGCMEPAPIIMFHVDRGCWRIIVSPIARQQYGIRGAVNDWATFAAALDKHFTVKED